MARVFMVLLVVMGLGCASKHTKLNLVTLEEVIKNSSAFEGHQIKVRGYYIYEHQGHFLFSTPCDTITDLKSGIVPDFDNKAIWFDFSNKVNDKQLPPQSSYVEMEGLFRNENQYYSGKSILVEKISQVGPAPSQDILNDCRKHLPRLKVIEESK